MPVSYHAGFTQGIPHAFCATKPREALHMVANGEATPADIARAADTGGVSTVIRPYLEALTANG